MKPRLPDTDAGGSPLGLREIDFERFFRPRAMAVIGASDSPTSQAALNFRLLREWQEPLGTRIFPVNPRREEVAGLKCYRSLTAVPDEIDVACILIAEPEPAIAEAAEKRVPFVMVFAAGFAEAGKDGAARQAKALRLIEGTGTRILGPNTTLNAWQPFRDDLPGKRIALITQSGHQGRPMYQAMEVGVIGLEGWAPTGNEADLESADFIRYFADRDGVGAIAMYVEGFKDGHTLARAADHAARRGVPIVTVKTGRTDLGRDWAQSHSGHLAGSDAVVSAFFRQYGIARVDGLDELLDVSAMLARCPEPAGDGVAIYSISGGTSAHMADWAGAAGLRLPELTQETQDLLHDWIPEFLRVSNPVDSGGIATGDERGPKILGAILADPNVDVLIVPIAGSFSPISDRFAGDIVEAARTSGKIVCVIWGSPRTDEPGYRDVLLGSGLPVFRSARNCLTAVKAYFDWHGFRRRYRSPFTGAPTAASAPDARKLLDTGRALSEHRSKEILRAYGIPVTRDALTRNATAAVRAAEEIGYPVVLKVCSPVLLHKSDLGLVRVDLSTPKEVRAAYKDLMARALSATDRKQIEGVLVSEMIRGGVETILGVVRDELFGPVVMFGLGGIAVEVYRDVTFRVPPFDRDEARRMIEEIRALPLLQGARGAPPADLDALADAITAVQRLALDLSGELAELDVNPLMALPDGCVALDALAVAR